MLIAYMESHVMITLWEEPLIQKRDVDYIN